MDFDYKKYSLDNLENWMHDAFETDASPTEIYDCILNTLQKNVEYHNERKERAEQILKLFKNQ